MTKSSFIRNNIADDYYTGKEIESRVATGVYNSSKYGIATGVMGHVGASSIDNYLGRTYDVALALSSLKTRSKEYGTTVKKEWQTAVVYKEPEVVRIPAKSAKAFCSFDINSCRISAPGLKAQYSYKPIVYTKQTSPLIMTNRICSYKEGEEPVFHNMSFYISEIGNVMELSSLIEPTSFYISYSSRLENGEDYQYFSEDEDVNSSFTESVTANVGVLKVDDNVEYNGVQAVVVKIVNSQLILVAKQSAKGTWNEAIEYCGSLGGKWSLPSCEDLSKIAYKLSYDVYWTCNEINDKKAYYFNCYARCEYSASKDREMCIQPVAIVEIDDLN